MNTSFGFVRTTCFSLAVMILPQAPQEAQEVEPWWLLWALSSGCPWLLHMHYTKVKCVVVAAWQMHCLSMPSCLTFHTKHIDTARFLRKQESLLMFTFSTVFTFAKRNCCLDYPVFLYLGLLHCLSRKVTPLSQLREQPDQDDHSDHWPCWGLGPSSPCFTHWPLRHHWKKTEGGIMDEIEGGRRREAYTNKEQNVSHLLQHTDFPCPLSSLWWLPVKP